MQRLVHDADIRRAIIRGMGLTHEPFTVWNDFDQTSSALTETVPANLPKWRDIGEYLKFHLLFQVALEDGGYSFTVRVRPDLEKKWKAENRIPMDRINGEVRKKLDGRGLKGLEYCYVVERRTRSGKSQTAMHLHGFFLTRDPLDATRVKVAMEEAIAVHPKGRAAAGISPRAGDEVVIEPSYDVEDDTGYGRGRWVSYMAKNATKSDAWFRRRVFMSRSATQTAREFWALVREEPLD